MNTLPREVRLSFFRDRDHYLAFRAQWKALPRVTPAHALLYQALRGRDWRRSFGPISNPRKLENGAIYGWGLTFALRALRSEYQCGRLLADFGGTVDAAAVQRLRDLLPMAREQDLIDCKRSPETLLARPAYAAAPEVAYAA